MTSDETVVIEIVEEPVELVTVEEVTEVTVISESATVVETTEEPAATLEVQEEPATVVEFEAGERGPEGAKGDSFAWKSDWAIGHYSEREVVGYNGSTYVRLVTGDSAVAPALDIFGWDLFARGFTAEEVAHFADTDNPHEVDYLQVGAEPAGVVATHSATPHPTADQKAAMAGTVGPPSSSNKFVTQADPRLIDARTPKAHQHVVVDISDLMTLLANYQTRAERGLAGGYASLGLDGKIPTVQVPVLAHSHNISDVSSLNTQLAGKQSIIEKGTAGGYAGLDSSGRVPVSQLPLNVNPCKLVAVIDDRDRLQDKFDGMHVLVKDASADPTVEAGWATYIYDLPNDDWFKASEGESIDVITSWDDVVNKPDLITRLQSLVGTAGLSCVIDPTSSGIVFQYPNYDGLEEPNNLPIIPDQTNNNNCTGSGTHGTDCDYYYALDGSDSTRWWANSYNTTAWMAWISPTTAYYPMILEIGRHNMQDFSLCGRNSDSESWVTLYTVNLPDSAYSSSDPLYPWTSTKKQYILVDKPAYKQFKLQSLGLFGTRISTLREPMVYHWQVYGYGQSIGSRAVFKPHRGTDSFRAAYKVPIDEFFYCKDAHRLYIGDGSKIGGWLLSPRSVLDFDDVSDTSLSGKAGRLLTVNETEDGFELQSPAQALPARVSDLSPLATDLITEYDLGFSSMEVNDLSWPETAKGHLVTVKKDNEYAVQWFAPYDRHILMYRIWSVLQNREVDDNFTGIDGSYPEGYRWYLDGRCNGRIYSNQLRLYANANTSWDCLVPRFKLQGDFEFTYKRDFADTNAYVYACTALTTTILPNPSVFTYSSSFPYFTGVVVGGYQTSSNQYLQIWVNRGTSTSYSNYLATTGWMHIKIKRVGAILYVYNSLDPVTDGWVLRYTNSNFTTADLYPQFRVFANTGAGSYASHYIDDIQYQQVTPVWDDPDFGWYEWRYSMDNSILPMDPSQFYRSDGQWAVPMGGGDMVKTTYDTNNDGIVDHAALADTVPGSGVQQDTTHRLITDAERTSWNGMQPASEKGAANGYAGLDATGKVPSTQLPAAILGGLNYQGTWNASTNTPSIPAAASTNKGWYYKVSVAGTTPIDGISDWQVGDWLVSNGTAWDKVDNTELVISVAGRVGAVVLTKSDVNLDNVDNTSDQNKPISSATQTALDTKQASLGFTPENSANKGQASGYAGLDATGKVPTAQLPAIAADFLSLTDTPSSYSGQGGKNVKVKVAGDGLEFGEDLGGHTILADGTEKPQRTKLNFAGFDVTDDSTNDLTKIQLAGNHLPYLIKEVTLDSAQSEVVFDGLDGLVDGGYVVEVQASGTAALGLFINGDSTAGNYVSESLRVAGTTVSGLNDQQATLVTIYNDGYVNYGRSEVFFDNSRVSMDNHQRFRYNGAEYLQVTGTRYTPTVSNITSLVVSSSGVANAGSVFRLYRKKPVTPVEIDPSYLCNLVKEVNITGSAVSEISFDSLDGNYDQGYVIKVSAVNSSGSSLDIACFVNDDTTSTSYYTRYSSNSGSGVLVNSNIAGYTNNGMKTFTNIEVDFNAGKYTWFSHCVRNPSGTSLDHFETAGYKIAELSNLTKLTLKTGSTTCFGVGTRVQLYRRRYDPALVVTHRQFSHLVEEKRVTSDCTSLTFSSLDSVQDGDYVLEASVPVNAATGESIYLGVNGDTTDTNYHRQYVGYVNGGTSSTGESATRMGIWRAPVAPSHYRIDIKVADGYVTFLGQGGWSLGTDLTALGVGVQYGVYKIQITKITSLQLNAAVIPAGSNFKLFKSHGFGLTSKFKARLDASNVMTNALTGPSVVVQEGTYSVWEEINFSATSNQKAFWTIQGSDYRGSRLKATLRWYATETSGTVLWRLGLKAAVVGSIQDTAYEAVRDFPATTPSTTVGSVVETVMSFDPTTAELIATGSVKLYLERDAVTDTMAADASLLSLELLEM